MSADDLLTPELKAMADSVRAASLKHSVKEALAAPTAKRTHKGEEAIETSTVAAVAEEEERALAEKAEREEQEQAGEGGAETNRERSASIAGIGADAGSPSENLNSSSAPKRVSISDPAAVEVSTEDFGLDLDEEPVPNAPESKLPTSNRRASDTAEGDPLATAAERPRKRSNFDMSSILSKIKQPTKSATPEDTSATGKAAESQESQADEDLCTKPATREDDDFEEILLRGEDASARRKSMTSSGSTLTALPTLWSGDVLVTDEGGFPANAVHVGGRYVGTDPATWKRLLPKRLSTDGRIPTATAVKYLIECAVSPSRELFVLAALPDLTGPTDDNPHKPTREKCLSKFQHIIDFYVKKDRIGVVAPKGELKQLVKDIYLMPLRKDDFLPEYVDLLDEHDIPSKESRDQDLLLVVIVAQKDVVPSATKPKTALEKPTSTTMSTATTAAAAPSIPSGPSATAYIPPAAEQAYNPVPNFDPSALNSLLSNPALLQSAIASGTQAPPAPSYQAPYGANQQYQPGPYGYDNQTSWMNQAAGAWPRQAYSVTSPYGALAQQQPYNPSGGTTPVYPGQATGRMSPSRNDAGYEPGGGGGNSNIHPSRLAMMQGGSRGGGGSGRGGSHRGGGSYRGR